MRRSRWKKKIVWLSLLALLYSGYPAGATGLDTIRKLLVQGQPRYPELALQMRVWGDIRMQVTVLPSGAVEQVTVLSGHPLLRNAACEAVQQWRYSVGTEKTQVEVVLSFRLP